MYFRVCFLLLFVVIGISGDKYSKHANENREHLNKDRLFRSNKLNLIWQKAEKRLKADELPEFKREMETQDKMEMSLKQMRADGMDLDGEHDAAIRRKFIGLMKRFGLTDILDERMMNEIPRGRENRFDDPRRRRPEDWDPKRARFEGDMRADVDGKQRPYRAPDQEFMDNRLTKIWKQAQSSGFSSEELRKLRTELDHQQDKMDEYNILSNTVHNFAADNNVQKFDDPINAGYKDRKVELKQKYIDLKENYDVLEAYVSSSSSSDEFTEPRVLGLWHLAQKAHFTDVELNSFKEELLHFERKLEKSNYLKKELDMQKLKKHRVDPENTKYHERYDQMEKKVQDYEHKIRKTHLDLKHRITAKIEL